MDDECGMEYSSDVFSFKILEFWNELEQQSVGRSVGTYAPEEIGCSLFEAALSRLLLVDSIRDPLSIGAAE